MDFTLHLQVHRSNAADLKNTRFTLPDPGCSTYPAFHGGHNSLYLRMCLQIIVLHSPSDATKSSCAQMYAFLLIYLLTEVLILHGMLATQNSANEKAGGDESTTVFDLVSEAIHSKLKLLGVKLFHNTMMALLMQCFSHLASKPCSNMV